MTAGPAAPAVIPASAADLVLLSRVIAEAFHPLPPSRWLIPDRAARAEIFPGYFALLAAHALAAGTVTTVPGRTAAALWLPPDADDPGGYEERLAAITGPWASRFTAFDETLHQAHPGGVEHPTWPSSAAVTTGRTSRRDNQPRRSRRAGRGAAPGRRRPDRGRP